MKKAEYNIKDLTKDLERLNKKAEALEKLDWDSKYLSFLDKQELTEKIIAPIYLVKQMEIFKKYFDVGEKIEIKHSR